MKIITEFTPVTAEQLQELASELKGMLSEQDHGAFIKYVSPYETFGAEQLDNIFLITRVTIRGNGQVENLNPECSIDQADWSQVEDEPDIRIDSVSIPLRLLTPPTPFEVSGSKTFLAVLVAEGNIWDSCKDLPSWVWNEGKFEFMMTFSLNTGNGKVYHGNQGDEYANQLIEF